jgi:hypothetical protein
MNLGRRTTVTAINVTAIVQTVRQCGMYELLLFETRLYAGIVMMSTCRISSHGWWGYEKNGV